MTRLGYPEMDEHSRLLPIRVLRAQHALRTGAFEPDAAIAKAGRYWDSLTREHVEDILTRATRTDLDGAAGRGPGGDFLTAPLRTRSIIDRLLELGASRVPAYGRTLTASGTVYGTPTKGGRAIKVSTPTLDAAILRPCPMGAIIVVTREDVEDASADLEAYVADLSAAGADAAVNAKFADPYNSGSDDSPASPFYGAPTIDSAGTSIANIATDLERGLRELSDLGSDLSHAVWIVHPRTAADLATMHTTDGARAFPGMTPAGGELDGVPCIASAAVYNGGSPTATQLLLVDAADVAIADAGATVSLSDATTLELGDSPAGDASTPTAASQTLISMFDADTIAIKCVRRAAWKSRRGFRIVIEGVTY